MMTVKISPKGILLILYSVVIFFVGVVFVPVYEISGSDKIVSGHGYLFLFKLMSDRVAGDGYPILYEIDYALAIYTIGVVTLLAGAIWVLLSTWEKEDNRV